MTRWVLRAKKLARLLRTGRYRAALRHGIGASVELDRVPFRRDIRTVIDVGANRGQFAAFALERFPGARIRCFEPLAAPAQQLARYARERGEGRVTVQQIALGAADRIAHMHVMREDDASSLLPLGDPQRRLGSSEVATVEVPVRRLDAVVRPEDVARPCLLKIDVQGTELEVLRGAEGLLAAVDEILVECSYVAFYEGQPLADAIVAYLDAHGAPLRYALPSIVAGGRVLQADLLFSRPTLR